MSVLNLFNHRRRTRTAFVLGGGGNLGAIQVGMIKALVERGIVPDEIVGCSVGALNGAALASNPTVEGVDVLADCWRELISRDIFPAGRLNGPWMLVRRAESLYSNYALSDVIKRWIPSGTFESCRIPLHVVATDMGTGRAHWFREGNLSDPLLASSALPAIFPPVVIDGIPYIDGGVVDNVPITYAAHLKVDRVYVLHVGNFRRPRSIPKRPLDVLVQAFSIARSHRFYSDSDSPPEGVEIITLPGVDPGSIRYNDFSKSAKLIAQGHQVAASFLDSHAVASGH